MLRLWLSGDNVERRRSSDREHSLEDDFVTSRFCDERDGSMKERMNKIEVSVESLQKSVTKILIQYASIMAVIVFVGAVAGLVMQYMAIHAGVKP
jgi:hypothetical protein